MKRRNKKTGEIKDLETIVHEAFKVHEVETIKNIEANWEDYKPKEPLIKDKKIINLLRPWIKFNKIEKAIIFKNVSETRGFEDSWFHIKGQDCNWCWWDIEIHASYTESVDKDYHQEWVDIIELCGEEE